MADLLGWWILFVLVGWATFPICFSLFKNQFDKGYSFSKIAGLLIWGYLYWLGNVFGIIGNTKTGTIFTLIVVIVISLIEIYRTKRISAIGLWIKENVKTIFAVETVFLLSIIFMVVMRGANPNIIGTEKPMELTFINGILKSTQFPPHDPWLSGYSISYYYFGYLMVSMIIKVVGTNSGIAFNLALIFWFAMISIGSFGLLLNLLIGNNQKESKAVQNKRLNRIFLCSLIAPLFILVLSNGEGLLELLHSKGVFWQINPGGGMMSSFWSWLDIKELTHMPPLPLDWNINRNGGSWWWRASRVLQDYTIQGQSREVIDEFPFFSFFLGDLHPHVLAMPFVLLSIFTGYAFLKNKYEPHNDLINCGIAFWKYEFNWFFAFVLGSLIFLNTWDFPVYFGLAAILIFFKLYQENVSNSKKIFEILFILFLLGIICILIYIPFLLSFSSQAGGILPSLVFQSRSIHLAVMFLPFILVIVSYTVFIYGMHVPISRIIKNWLIVLTAYFLVLLISFTIPVSLDLKQKLYSNQQSITANLSFLSIYGANSTTQLIQKTIPRILTDPIGLLMILTLISIIVSAILYTLRRSSCKTKSNTEEIFIGFLLVLGLGLVLFPELFYLRDQFGWRMNTIFKFYFQAWILFSISSAYGISQFGKIKNMLVKHFVQIITLIGIIAGLIYPIKAFFENISYLNGMTFTLDGNKYLEKSNPDELQAVKSLSESNYGIVSEAVGGSYTNFGRVSKLTGLSTVLGWPGHELQWRGGSAEIGSREQDIKELYSSKDWDTAKSILDKYSIRFVYIGDLERDAYQVSEEKFSTNLPIFFSNQSVTIYENYQVK